MEWLVEGTALMVAASDAVGRTNAACSSASRAGMASACLMASCSNVLSDIHQTASTVAALTRRLSYFKTPGTLVQNVHTGAYILQIQLKPALCCLLMRVLSCDSPVSHSQPDKSSLPAATPVSAGSQEAVTCSKEYGQLPC